MMVDIVSELERLGQKYSMSHWGTAQLAEPVSFEFYRTWIQNNYHGEMKYLKDHLEFKKSPKTYWAKAESGLVFAKSYLPFPSAEAQSPLKAARTALYSQGHDYHHWFKQELREIAQELATSFPDSEFLAMTDSSPVMERDLAAKAGLGWFGKNTCLIHPKKGSLFFIGEIYTDLAVTPNGEVFPDFCGNCSRCIDICPTNAIEAPRVLDARKCISYWTIESKQVAPENLRAQFNDWFFGCDLCQTICPWNQKIFKASLETQIKRTPFDRETLIIELREILLASGKQLQKKFLGSPLARAGAFGLKRNAIIVAANLQLSELRNEIEKCKELPKLAELTAWALTRLESSSSEELET